jgi:hypothetical protein
MSVYPLAPKAARRMFVRVASLAGVVMASEWIVVLAVGGGRGRCREGEPDNGDGGNGRAHAEDLRM